MRKFLLSATLCMCLCPAAVAQTRAGGSSSSKTPAGSAYTLSDGSTVSKNNEALSTSTSDYNVVQVTKGTLSYTLTVGTSSGSGTVNETTGIISVDGLGLKVNGSDAIYTLDGRKADSNTKGIVIRGGKKFVVK